MDGSGYLDGYTHASARARRGFLHIVGDHLASAAGGALPGDSASFYLKAQYHGGQRGPNARQRTAAARAWLKSATRGAGVGHG